MGMSILIIDVITKMYAVSAFDSGVVVMPGLQFELVYNSGITFGLTSDIDFVRILVSLLQILLIASLIVYSSIRLKYRQPAWAPIMIAVGGIANMLSRIWYPGVVDFIIIGVPPYTWPACNIADIAIVCGVCILLWRQYKGYTYV